MTIIKVSKIDFELFDITFVSVCINTYIRYSEALRIMMLNGYKIYTCGSKALRFSQFFSDSVGGV